ncbi:MAG TPA: ABC transporter ATP-binding protein [bacterium]|nr:ABC transporter ATP-binding protein [bacterium]
MPAVATAGLVKRYPQGLRRPPVLALKGVTLEIPRGEVFSFLGPNGSGKTTLIKCLLDIAKPTAGTLSLLDRPVSDIQVRRQVGYLPESPYFYDRFTGEELLRFYGGLYAMNYAHLEQRIPVVIDEVGLGARAAARPLRTYSKGMLQRIGIAQALLAEPELIILDEPSTGLDPVGRRQIKDLIRSYHQRGHTVFLNTHILEDVEDLCHRVGIIFQGELLALQTIEELTQTRSAVVVRLRNPGLLQANPLPELAEGIAHLGSGRARLDLRDGVEVPAVVRALVHAGAEIEEITSQVVTLEDRFLDLIGEKGGIPESVRAQLAAGLHPVEDPSEAVDPAGGTPAP